MRSAGDERNKFVLNCIGGAAIKREFLQQRRRSNMKRAAYNRIAAGQRPCCVIHQEQRTTRVRPTAAEVDTRARDSLKYRNINDTRQMFPYVPRRQCAALTGTQQSFFYEFLLHNHHPNRYFCGQHMADAAYLRPNNFIVVVYSSLLYDKGPIKVIKASISFISTMMSSSGEGCQSRWHWRKSLLVGRNGAREGSGRDVLFIWGRHIVAWPAFLSLILSTDVVFDNHQDRSCCGNGYFPERSCGSSAFDQVEYSRRVFIIFAFYYCAQTWLHHVV